MGRIAWISRASFGLHFRGRLRSASVAAFRAHGTQKWLSFPPRRFAQPELFSMTGGGGSIELIGGGLILLGLFTRPAAFICSGMMAVGYFLVHAPQSFFPVQIKAAEIGRAHV